MKNKITTLILLLLALYGGLNAQQEYKSCFGKETTKWIIVHPSSFWGMEEESSPNYYTIDSILCYGWYYKEQPTGVVFYETDNNSKLWRWDPQTSKKSILMDLNWEVGDTIHIDTKEFKQKYEERPYAVVDSVFFDLKNRKVIHTDIVLQLDTTNFNLKYTEGIGPNASMFLLEEYGMFWGMSDLLLCAYKDDVLSYTNTEAGGECTYPLPVSVQTPKSKPKVVVSFQSSTIGLIFEDTFSGKLILITPEGKVVRNVNINRNNKSVSIKDIPDGLYIIQVTDRTGKYCMTQKIFKRTSK
jgi:hypothetical protein